MAIKKQYLKGVPICKVTFTITKEIAKLFKRANLLGSFNNWDAHSHPMKKLVKDGSFSITIDLEKGNEYQFRYLLDGEAWVNESEADKHMPTYFPDAENSIIIV